MATTAARASASTSASRHPRPCARISAPARRTVAPLTRTLPATAPSCAWRPCPCGSTPTWRSAVHFAGESSRTTHGAAECVDACKLYAAMLHQALSGSAKDAILCDPFGGLDVAPPLSPSIQAIADGAYFDKGEDEISGSGYVVHSLEAALWCFHTTNTYRDAILRAVNLGDDADTTAAVCGQIARRLLWRAGHSSRVARPTHHARRDRPARAWAPPELGFGRYRAFLPGLAHESAAGPSWPRLRSVDILP